MEESSSETYRDWLLDHMSATTCPACHGKRLRPESLAVKVNGMSIADFTALPVSRAVEAAGKIKLSERENRIAGRILKEIAERLGVPECRRPGLHLAEPFGRDAEWR